LPLSSKTTIQIIKYLTFQEQMQIQSQIQLKNSPRRLKNLEILDFVVLNLSHPLYVYCFSSILFSLGGKVSN
jgi:hypothetical protein